jgi:hypothetical protein
MASRPHGKRLTHKAPCRLDVDVIFCILLRIGSHAARLIGALMRFGSGAVIVPLLVSDFGVAFVMPWERRLYS